jgi:hypothetical protein
MKNTIYVIVIAVCLLLAIIIFIKGRSGGSGGLESMKRGELFWVMCNNPKCKATYQIDKVDYHTEIREKIRANPTSMMQTPPLTCKKCGENSVYRAFKCPKCEHMFFYGKTGDFDDRCPKCGFSKMEDDRKKALEARKAG